MGGITLPSIFWYFDKFIVPLSKPIWAFRFLESSTISLLNFWDTMDYVVLPGLWINYESYKNGFVKWKSNKIGKSESSQIEEYESNWGLGQGAVQKCPMAMTVILLNKWLVLELDIDSLTLLAMIMMTMKVPGAYTYT